MAINNQRNCQQPAALPKPCSTPHHFVLQSHSERLEIVSRSASLTENKNVLYTNRCSCLWSAEQHTGVDQAEHRLSSAASSLRCVRQRTSICFSLSHSPSHIPLQSERMAAFHVSKEVSENIRFYGKQMDSQ